MFGTELNKTPTLGLWNPESRLMENVHWQALHSD